MADLHKVNTLARLTFPLYSSAGALVTGEAANVTNVLAKDGSSDATSVTVAEVGTTGVYSATFTPASAGEWYLLVRHATYAPRGVDFGWRVTTDGPLAASDVATAAAAGVLTTPAQKLFTDVSGSVNALLGPNVVTASALADDAVAEIQAGLATAADQAAIIGHVDTLEAGVVAILAGIAAIPAAPTANENADALLDRTDGVETGVTPRQAWQRIGAGAAGRCDVSPDGATVTFYGLDGVTLRITATVDTTTGARSAAVGS